MMTMLDDVVADVRTGLAAAGNGYDGEPEPAPSWAQQTRVFTLGDCERLRLQPIVRHLLWRKIMTIMTSLGGLGKSRAVVQAIIESALGRPVWGLADFAALEPALKWLVVFGEDPVEMIAGVIRPVLTHYGLSEAPFLSLCADDLPEGDLTLTDTNITYLIEMVRDLGIDAVAIDTRSACCRT